MNVIKTKIISLKLAKHESKERTDGPGGSARLGYARRFSLPCGQAVESWKKENSLGVCPEEEEEYPIYQSASFRRSVITFNKSGSESSFNPSLNHYKPSSSESPNLWLKYNFVNCLIYWNLRSYFLELLGLLMGPGSYKPQ